MTELDAEHHIFRHIKQSWMDGDFVDPAAFRLRKEDDGTLEAGLSVNWVEYFKKITPEEAIPALRAIFEKKGRTVGGSSKFALLNVGKAIEAASEWATVTVELDEAGDDPSHALLKGYEAHNDEVSEELAKVVIAAFPAKP